MFKVTIEKVKNTLETFVIYVSGQFFIENKSGKLFFIFEFLNIIWFLKTTENCF